ncbi:MULTISPECIES: class I SAM-dependent methyltransferase [unclassified Granulicatella]|uniref:class I SAM-dependent methyltransferase n=1 Tax=unclassified Granulicatella TaxID=2630493 RepID=UPI0010738381|nr:MULTISPECIES: class I SAM-dependent methyltransferase [unclassified Granulicatella]MBF0780177.1 class I SAM-dependent methyltransferase [Granulicatella sp. 19428wC4_WM01]TFU95728.1 class I SAM-dependent methyltransferase [Granulicatella sp. WM01]
MTEISIIEQVNILWKSVEILQSAIDYSYVEALGETLQNIVNEEVQQVQGVPSESDRQQLEQLYQRIDKQLSAETMRKVIQYTFLKAAKQDKLQMNHQMTPDTVALVIGFMVNALILDKKYTLNVGDFALGAGNLLACVAQFLIANHRQVTLMGSDNDDVLVHLASQSLALQKLDVNLLLQDSLRPMYIDLLNIAISDLPIGYYPDKDQAAHFKTASQQGLSYAHHLLIEQHIYHLKPGGFGIFIVPSTLFETTEATSLLQFLTQQTYIQALLQLPSTLFQQENQQKSVLIVQKKAPFAKQASQVLLGHIPEFKQHDKFRQFVQTFEKWAKENCVYEDTV